MKDTPGHQVQRSKRDPRFDAVRGLALVIMMVAHLPFVEHVVFRPLLGLATAGEAFVLLSGIVSGMVLLRRRRRDGRASLWRSARRRLRSIYAAHLVVVAAIVMLSVGLAAIGDPRLADGELGRLPIRGFFAEYPLLAMVHGAAFLVLPAFAGILPLYIAFTVLGPILAECRLRGGWPSAIVLAASGVLWSSAQFGVDDVVLAWIGEYVAVHASNFRFSAWQLLFVAGFYLGTPNVGATRALGAEIVDRATRVRGLLATCGVGFVGGLLLRYDVVFDVETMRPFWAALDPSRLRPGALVAVGVMALLTASVVTRLSPRAAKSLPMRALALLGRHSLVVFTFHVAIVVIVSFFTPVTPALFVPIAALAVAALFLPAVVCELPRIPALVPEPESLAPITAEIDIAR